MMTAATDTINTTTISDIHNRFDRPPQQQAQSLPQQQQPQHNIIRTSSPPQSQQAIYSSSVTRRTTMNDPPGRTALDDVYNNTDYDDSDNMHHDYNDNDKFENNHHQDDMTFDWSSISSIGDDHSRYDDDDDYDNYDNCNDNDDDYDNYDNYNDNDDDMVPDRTITSTTTGDVIVEASASIVVPTQHDQQRPKKHVTFGMVETYEVQSLKDYETDDTTNNNNTSFWYSSYEMLSTRKAGRILCITDPNVRNFLYYYEYLYRKLISNDDHNDHEHEDKTNTMETTDSDTATSNITALDTKILAYGLCDGYQGLERESSFEVYRQKERREVVRMILDVHHSMKDKQLDTNNNDDELLRSYALSLTTKMSYWAYCIGQAGHLASNEDALYQTTNVIA